MEPTPDTPQERDDKAHALKVERDDLATVLKDEREEKARVIKAASIFRARKISEDEEVTARVLAEQLYAMRWEMRFGYAVAIGISTISSTIMLVRLF